MKRTVIIILIIIVLFALGIFVGYKKINGPFNKEETKVDNTINDFEQDSSYNDIETEITQYNINGRYEMKYDPDYIGTSCIYEFNNGEVKSYSDGTNIGTYTIDGDKINIKNHTTISPDDEVIETWVKELTFIIKDDNILISPEGEEFIKINN